MNQAVKNRILKPTPSLLVIFGATGNLTRRKLLPAFYDLWKGDLLPQKFLVLGVARQPLSEASFRKILGQTIPENSGERWKKFTENVSYHQMDFNNEADFAALAKRLDEVEDAAHVCFTRIIYLATLPPFYPKIFEALKKYELNLGCRKHNNTSRIVIEKPFGKDLPSAKELNRSLREVFSETQIYRIDHYLAKETVQNILAFRFANEVFEPILNHDYVDNIQILMAEDVGVEDRGEYYEEAGALRDVIQNHLLQILAITTMNEPKKFAAAEIRAEKVKLLREVKMIRPEEVNEFVVRGQYGPGEVGGVKSIGYRKEPEVNSNSSTETFVAMKLFIDNDCWRGVPMYLKAGKRLARKLTTVTVQFKEAGHALFSHLTGRPEPNLLTFQLQPDEGISIRLVAKKPGLKLELTSVDMEFCYAAAFREKLPDAYERLLLDIMLGDQTLFPHRDEVLRSWEIVDNILEGWQKLPTPKFPNYTAGSWGPKESDDFIKKDGRQWLAHELKICQLHSR